MDEELRGRVGALFHERWRRLGLEALLPEERDHVLLWELHVEVGNGGLDQYLSNGSGDHAEETVEALVRVGLAVAAEIVRRAMDALPGGWCSDREERGRRIAATPDRWATFRSLTDRYHEAIASEPAGDGLAESVLAAYRREGLLS